MNHPGEIAAWRAIAAPTVALVNNAQREHQEFMATVEAVARENGAVIAALGRRRRRRVPGRRRIHAALARAARARAACMTFGAAGDADVVRPRPNGTAAHWQVSVHTPPARLTVRDCTSPAATTCATRWRRSPARSRRACRSTRSCAAWKPSRRSRAARRRRRCSCGGRTVTLSTTPTTPTPIRCAPRSTCWPSCRRRAVLVLGDMGEVGDQGPEFHREVGAYAQARGIEQLLHARRARARMRRIRQARAHFADIDALNAAVLGAAAAARATRARQGLALHEDGARGRRPSPRRRTTNKQQGASLHAA